MEGFGGVKAGGCLGEGGSGWGCGGWGGGVGMSRRRGAGGGVGTGIDPILRTKYLWVCNAVRSRVNYYFKLQAELPRLLHGTGQRTLGVWFFFFRTSGSTLALILQCLACAQLALR